MSCLSWIYAFKSSHPGICTFFPCVICKLSTEDRASGTAGSECSVSVYIRYIGVVIAGPMRCLAEVFGCCGGQSSYFW